MAAALRSLGRFRRLLHDAADQKKLAKRDSMQDLDAIVRLTVASKVHSNKAVQDRDAPPWASRAFRVALLIGVSFTCGCNIGKRTYHRLRYGHTVHS